MIISNKAIIFLLLICAVTISAVPNRRVKRFPCFFSCGIQDVVSNAVSGIVKGPSYTLSKLPKLPNILPAGPVRRGPYGGVCGCLGNLGGCYIDPANPPGPGFTCTCVKAEDWLTGKNYACVGLGYRLGWNEEHTGGTYDLKQCKSGLKSPSLIKKGDCGGYIESFGDQEWNKVRNDVTIKLFAAGRFHQVESNPGSGERQCGIWEQGEDIDCMLDGEEAIVRLPYGFNKSLPVKGMIHGFADDARFRTEIVSAYHKKFNGNVNVILFDWSPLAKAIDIDDTLDNYLYYRAARNVPIVGEYLGRCLAGISKATGLRGRDIHIAGHSLGGQMLGRLGRAYTRWVKRLTGSGEKIGRLTGLDPAGPAFVDGDVPADPMLYKERLSSKDASFVDVIHTNADRAGPILLNTDDPTKMRLGDYGPNGHYDFYPDGGNLQKGCNPDSNIRTLCKIACNHERSIQYLVSSINDNCILRDSDGEICMGEQAIDSWTGKAYNIPINSENWYQKHESDNFVQDCIHTARFACQALANIFTYYIDASICAKDFSLNCELYSEHLTGGQTIPKKSLGGAAEYQGQTILIESLGRAAEHWGRKMGYFDRIEENLNGRPVYKQRAGDVFLYHSAERGTWQVSDELGKWAADLKVPSEAATPVTTGWQYYGGGEWRTDKTLTLTTSPADPSSRCTTVQVAATGPAASAWSSMMGRYRWEGEWLNGRKRFRGGRDGDRYLRVPTGFSTWKISSKKDGSTSGISSGRATTCPCQQEAGPSSRYGTGWWEYSDDGFHVDWSIRVTCE